MENLFPEDVRKLKPEEVLPKELLREDLPFLGESELEVVRYFTRLSQKNFSVDSHFYPLGSCSMKYNPRINEEVSHYRGFLNSHPLCDEGFVQGCLKVMFLLQELLKELGGFKGVSLQPMAGAQGELTGLLMIKKFHRLKRSGKDVVLIPDTAHGTNPASASMVGFKVLVVKSNKEGEMDFDDFMRKLDDRVACLMITNPNTLGIFERRIGEVAEELHKKGALLYMDGANFNALVGRFRPGDWGVDVMHFNLHKTFSTPHGGGGPGAGPVGVSQKLLDFLPVPLVAFDGKRYYLNYKVKHSVGRLSTFYGNFLVFVKALAYLLRLGDSIKDVSTFSVLKARYLRELLKGVLKDPFPNSPTMHEFVLSAAPLLKYGVRALDLAKGLLDKGFHAPTIYFPLIVRESLMIEPTETETFKTLREFAKALKELVELAKREPKKLKELPKNTPVGRVDEVKANRQLVVRD